MRRALPTSVPNAVGLNDAVWFWLKVKIIPPRIGCWLKMEAQTASNSWFLFRLPRPKTDLCLEWSKHPLTAQFSSIRKHHSPSCALPLLLAERSIKYNVNGRTCSFSHTGTLAELWEVTDPWDSQEPSRTYELPKASIINDPPSLNHQTNPSIWSNPPNGVVWVQTHPLESSLHVWRDPLPCSLAIGCVSKDSPFCKRQSKVKRTFVAPAESAISKKSSNLSCCTINGINGSFVASCIGWLETRYCKILQVMCSHLPFLMRLK